ncbi:MAG TPA: PKD domain-containing protein [Prolixibacteraceae bacterium]
MGNRLRGIEHYIEITVSSRIGAQLSLTYGPNDTPIQVATVGASQSVTLRLEYTDLEPFGSDFIENKGVHLVSDELVNIYALNYRTQSSDVAVIYPTISLGNEYYAMCYTPNPTSNAESNSEFLIVASQDNTTVKITPSVDTDQNRHKAMVEYSVLLQKGQSYQVQSLTGVGSVQGDLTGSRILADKPIAFYSGAMSTAVPYTLSTVNVSRDHLYEQIPPISTWGREFYVVPLKLRSKDTYRILASEDGTSVIVEALNRTIVLNRGKYAEFELSSSQASRIVSNKRILLAQYCRYQKADESTGVGDPFMIILSSVVQKINNITFEAYTSDLITDIFYVNIVTLTSEKNAISLDGTDIGSYFKPFPNGLYSYAQVPISKGTHTLKNDNQTGGFLAYVYGYGNRGDTESYGYGVGFNLDIQLEIGGDFSGDEMVICSGFPKKLEAQGNFERYEWSTKEIGSSIMVSKEGLYTVTGYTAAGCEKSASVYVKVDKPEVNLGEDIGSCHPGDLVLNAGSGFKSYLWQDGSTNATFTVMETGTYTVTATNELGCQASDNIYVFVFDPRFTQNYDVATDLHPDISFVNQTEHGVRYLWEFGDGATSEVENPVHHYNQVGDYKVVLQVTSDSGCIDTTSSSVRIIPFKVNTPNAFRPDSEIPVNRIFLPITEGMDPQNYNLKVFNRVGSIVFETSNPETGWDGNSEGPGIFVWIVKFKDIQGYNHLQKGTVMLVR